MPDIAWSSPCRCVPPAAAAATFDPSCPRLPRRAPDYEVDARTLTYYDAVAKVRQKVHLAAAMYGRADLSFFVCQMEGEEYDCERQRLLHARVREEARRRKKLLEENQRKELRHHSMTRCDKSSR